MIVGFWHICLIFVYVSIGYLENYSYGYHFLWSLIQLSLAATVDADEIRRLGKRFRKLDLDNSGSLSVEEFMSLPELQQNPLVQRVIDIFDADGNGEVDFKGIFLSLQSFTLIILNVI